MRMTDNKPYVNFYEDLARTPSSLLRNLKRRQTNDRKEGTMFPEADDDMRSLLFGQFVPVEARDVADARTS